MDTTRKQLDIAGSSIAVAGNGIAQLAAKGIEKRYRKFLINEAMALLTRLQQLQPFEFSMPMVTAASIPYDAQKNIYELMKAGKNLLADKARGFILKMKSTNGIPFEKCQSAYSVLKLQFNSLLDQFDIFADVVSQRGENETGIWVAGLDILAKDSILTEGYIIDPPPMICYLDRGHGAAIRRARTRLPGGDENPVAVIKIPRERMVASGIGSSLVHEVGHQASALLNLIASIKPELELMSKRDPIHSESWKLLSRWISEILSDFWSVSVLGISASTGLISVVSLPRYFVFRIVDDDPHPFPWIRVKISIGFGKQIYPDDQWQRLERLWETMYPRKGLNAKLMQMVTSLEEIIPKFCSMIINHQPESLKGKLLKELFPSQERQPAILRQNYFLWKDKIDEWSKQRPSMVFAVVGQARADNTITPFAENRLLTKALRHWALTNI